MNFGYKDAIKAYIKSRGKQRYFKMRSDACNAY